MKNVTINVTAEDIELGSPRRAVFCPIARAIRRSGIGTFPAVCSDYLSFVINGDTVTLPLPPEASQFVKDFDLGRSVKPFSFDIDIEGKVK